MDKVLLLNTLAQIELPKGLTPAEIITAIDNEEVYQTLEGNMVAEIVCQAFFDEQTPTQIVANLEEEARKLQNAIHFLKDGYC